MNVCAGRAQILRVVNSPQNDTFIARRSFQEKVLTAPPPANRLDVKGLRFLHFGIQAGSPPTAYQD